MKAWAIVLVALIAGAGAVAAALIIPRDDRAREVRPDSTPGANEPAFTVIGEDEDVTTASPSPAPTGAPSAVRGPESTAQPDDDDGRRRGRTSVQVTEGEFSEGCEGDLEDEEEEREEERDCR